MKRAQNKNRLKTFCYNKWSMMQLTKWQFYHLLNQRDYISILEIKERAAWIAFMFVSCWCFSSFWRYQQYRLQLRTKRIIVNRLRNSKYFVCVRDDSLQKKGHEIFKKYFSIFCFVLNRARKKIYHLDY